MEVTYQDKEEIVKPKTYIISKHAHLAMPNTNSSCSHSTRE